MPYCQPGERRNHSKGKSIKVEPITKRADLETIKRFLSDKPRDYALFIMGINTNLRASDLCRITVGMVRDKKAEDEIVLIEQKTGKLRRITLNSACVRAVQGLLSENPLLDNEQLFRGKRGPITTQTIHFLVNQWTEMCGVKGNFGSHTLRKTFGYWKRQQGASIPLLMDVFNHSNQKTTLSYLGIQPEEVKSLYLQEV